MDLGQKIRYYRKQRRLTQKDLADRLNKAQTTIMRYETGEFKPDIDIIKEIANILMIPVTELIGENTDSSDIDLKDAYDKGKLFHYNGKPLSKKDAKWLVDMLELYLDRQEDQERR